MSSKRRPQYGFDMRVLSSGGCLGSFWRLDNKCHGIRPLVLPMAVAVAVAVECATAAQFWFVIVVLAELLLELLDMRRIEAGI